MFNLFPSIHGRFAMECCGRHAIASRCPSHRMKEIRPERVCITDLGTEIDVIDSLHVLLFVESVSVFIVIFVLHFRV